ncbi:Uncharacterized protein family (UPF0220), putative [Trypanosoma equiperdum]|uniref:Uncharacterized protein n=2 Tax=Trypanozoon TaxID=39700 RepID=Q384E3_TRYB2|nr:hypothetical protein, conserved [Trypanosoma brucei brucei TREU927]EAN79838.1 hypothetical protein, conserved [Trypanosoma brucei brucei TREU927]SCU71448.1 Uncharacterised protein family (UPF0220), putative [Trypanosoma equiperdum]
MRALYQFVAGALFSASLFVFADGLIVATQNALPYNFLMWLPSLLMFCGMFVLCYVDAGAISNRYDLMGDGDSSRDRVFFFASVLFMVSGFAVSLWKAIDPYTNAGVPWPGASLVIQSALLIASFALLFWQKTQDSNSFL